MDRQRLALGHIETFDALGNKVVVETLTCAHCQKVFKKPMQDEPTGFCHMCFKQVCLECGKSDKCDPFEKKLERMEQRSRLLKSIEG